MIDTISPNLLGELKLSVTFHGAEIEVVALHGWGFASAAVSTGSSTLSHPNRCDPIFKGFWKREIPSPLLATHSDIFT